MAATIGWVLLFSFLVLLFIVQIVYLIWPVLPSVILRASCSVADVNEPRWYVSLPVAWAIMLAYAGLFLGAILLLGRLDANPDDPFGAMHLFGYMLAFVVGLGLAALLYRLLFTPSFLKSFRVAGLQLLLTGLALALMTGLILVTLSVWQMLGFGLPWSSAPPKPATTRAAPAAVAVDRS